jgi:NADPH:quinone reductase-like Zn-dependent oxidoreductase
VVCLALNHLAAYQMLHRFAKILPGESVLFHAAAGGVGTAQLQLGRLVGLTMFGTVSERLPLEEASRAHELIEASAVSGKIVLILNQ